MKRLTSLIFVTQIKRAAWYDVIYMPPLHPVVVPCHPFLKLLFDIRARIGGITSKVLQPAPINPDSLRMTLHKLGQPLPNA
jgi:hypothetical protein